MGDFVLNSEDIHDRSIVALRPEMTSVRGADELRGDADPFACLAHGAFEHRVDAELAANGTNVHLRLGDTKCRCA